MTNTNDSGSGSLRAAMLSANANAGLDAITFSIGTGAKTITPLSPLPTISSPVEILGNSQPGYNTTPLIELKGTSAGAGADGLHITAGGSVVVGLSIDGWGGDAVELSTGGGSQVSNSRLGTTGFGTGLANGGAGLHIVNSPNNIVDGRFCLLSCPPDPDYNVIVQNATGVRIEGATSTGNVVSRNLIGLASRTGPVLANQTGVDIVSSASNNRVGGTTVDDRNVISGNTSVNVVLEQNTSNNLLEGNYIGTNFAGTAALGGGQGVAVHGTNNTIGGATAAARNVISGNGGPGVWVTPSGATGNQILGNYVGTNAAGSAAIANSTAGVLLESASNTVGGAASGAGNVVAGNSGPGVQLRGGAAAGNQVLGNRVGTSAAGTAALPNQAGVVLVDAGAGNSVGGTAVGAGNLLSGNNLDGVQIVRTPGTDVLGNSIGTDAGGTADLGNGRDGVLILDTAGTSVGGSAAGARNVISGNNGNGVEITQSAQPTNSNLVLGNYIGTNAAGSGAVPNGIGVQVAAAGNTIGGSASGEGNVVSGNSQSGIAFVGATATGNIVAGNLVGTNPVGNTALPNGAYGILLSNAASNTIGGTAGGAGNVVSGNTGDGINVTGDGATGNVIAGNRIGTDSSGTVAIPNSNGVALDASGNTVGGTAAGSSNVISGNGANGVAIFQVASSTLPTNNSVQGNLIGTTANGTAALGNTSNGVFVFTATVNLIGGTTAAARNVISANSRGILIGGSGTTGNKVEGNYVGTDASGTSALGNAGPGIRVEDSAPSTVVGGTVKGAGNILSGNGGEGVDIEGGTKAQVLGNLIGTDATGAAALPNAEDGVLINNGSSNVLGGRGNGLNVISGNGANGVQIVGAAAKGNKLQGDYVGLRASGTAALANTLDGVLIDGAPSNTVGSTKSTLRNVISGNTDNGVEISGAGAKGNKVLGSFIGTQKDGSSALGNGADGVLVTTNAKKTTIGGTAAGSGDRIGFNAGSGVYVASGTGNAIRESSIFSNGGLGIDLDPAGVNPNDPGDPDTGANLGQNYPVLTSAASGVGTITIDGTFNSTPNTTGFVLEFFSSPSCDPTGFGEGASFLGLLSPVNTDASGNATFSVTLPVTVAPGSFVTSTATSPAANTSEFSHCRQSS